MLNNWRRQFACQDVTSKCSDIRVSGLDDVYIGEVQTANGCTCRAEEWSGQTLDSIAITANGASIALDWGPSLASQIYIRHEDYLLLQSSSLLCKCLQRSHILYYKSLVGCCVWDSIHESTHIASNERLLAVCLYGSIHYTALCIVESYIELCVDACRYCNVDVGWLVRECYALAKRVLDNLLRCLGSGSLTRCKVEIECTSNRLAVDGRNLRQNELCRTSHANLQDSCEVSHLCRELLAVGIHCRYTACEGCVRGVALLLCEEHLSCRGCRVGHAVRSVERARKGERCYCRTSLICCQSCRLNSVHRDLVALAPEERVEFAHLLAKLGTRLLERNSKLGHLAIEADAELLGCVSCTRKGEQRCNRKEKFC